METKKRFFKTAFTVVTTLSILTSCGVNKFAVTNRYEADTTTLQPSEIPQVGFNQRRLIREAETWLGTPYQYAAAEKGVGADCSGLVMKVFEKIYNIKLPRNSAKQAEYCVTLESNDVRSGDLVFFATGEDKELISHVGIMLDNQHFLHASSSKGVVVSDILNPYYSRTFLRYGRISQLHTQN